MTRQGLNSNHKTLKKGHLSTEVEKVFAPEFKIEKVMPEPMTRAGLQELIKQKSPIINIARVAEIRTKKASQS